MRKLSDDEKKKRGTYRKDRVKKPAAFTQAGTIPDPPDHLSTRAAELFYETASFLSEKGMLNDVVCRQVAVYAHEIDAYLECIAQLKKEGESRECYGKEGQFLYYQANPLTKIANAHLRIALAWAKQLLISPFDNDRIPPKKEPPEENPFERLARGERVPPEDFN